MIRTKIITKVSPPTSLGTEKFVPNFSANGSRVLEDGWLLVDPRAKNEDVLLPKVKVGETLLLLNLQTEEKQTQPPNRYSEAGLIKELEKRGMADLQLMLLP